MSCFCSRKAAFAVGLLFTLLLIVAIVLLGLLGFYDQLVTRMIYSSITITPTSSVYKNWVCPETPIFFSIYLFNITNRDAIEKGQKPRIQQIGPYVYREKREKTNITWPKGDWSQVSYYLRLTFTLDRNLSVGDPDKDIVTGVSMPFVSIAANMEAGNGPSRSEYSLMTFFATPKLFIKTSVTKFLWGYVDPITEVCHSFDAGKCPTNKVGVMYGKNGTDDGPFVVDTGVNNITQVGRILSYKNQTRLNVWASDKANGINGTDGSQLAPDLKPDSRRFIFAADLCRSFEMRVEGPGRLTNSEKVKVFSIGGTPETGQHASVNPENKGFCPANTTGPECPPAGMFDLSSCRRQDNIRPPVYSSQPYFFGADPEVRKGVDGLYEPNVDNSSTKVYVEPTLGLVLEAYKRLQISVYVRPSKDMPDQFKNWTKPVFLPVVWFEEKAVAPAKELDFLYENLYVKPQKGRYLLMTLLGVILGVLFLLLITFIVIVLINRRRNHQAGDGGKVHPNCQSSYDAKYSKVTMVNNEGEVNRPCELTAQNRM